MALPLALAGCTGIAIEPSCPAELFTGESGSVFANQENEGAIAKYLWEVFPADAGSLADSNAASTTFQAQKEGDVTFRLTASDGLYQVISECRTRIISFSSLAVTLAAEPAGAKAGDLITLTCTIEQKGDAATLTIAQVDGATVTLAATAGGVATFTPDAGGDYSFRCTAAGNGGEQAESDVLILTVLPGPDTQPGGDDNGTPPRTPGRR